MFSFPLFLSLASLISFSLGKQRWLSFYGGPHTRRPKPHLHTHTHLHIWSTLFYPFGPLTFCLCAFSIDFRLSLIGKVCQKCWPAAPPAPTTITPSSVCQLIAWLKNLMNFLDCSPPSHSSLHVLLLCLSHVYFFFLALFMLPSSSAASTSSAQFVYVLAWT